MPAFTLEGIKSLSHIPTEEIEKDIADTQAEIDQYELELAALGKGDRLENKLEIYIRESKIFESREFIDNLNSILEYRETLKK